MCKNIYNTNTSQLAEEISMIYLNSRFLTQNITGVQRFAIELSNALLQIRQDIVFLVPDLKAIVDKSILDKFNIKEVKGGYGHYWEQVTLPRYLKSIGSPLLVNLCNTSPILYFNKVSMLHDIAFIHYPKGFSWKFRMLYRLLFPLTLKTSKRIFTGSHFAAKDISAMYPFYKGNFYFLNSAVSSNFLENTKNLSIKLNPYALAVSSPNLHKNFLRMIEAFLKSDVQLELKIIGSVTGSFNTQNYENLVDSRIQFLGRVSDEELISLYQNADFFVFPSLYEGFGIPPLEAQACGCPVIASHAASLPEVLADSTLYFDPYNVDDIKHAIEIVSKDQDLRVELRKKGFENVKRFSWKTSASKLHDIINEVVNSEK